MIKKIIRVGEKNNFNFTERELADLRENWADKGLAFVNSNSLVRITSDYPSIITINPYFYFVEPIGDTSNVKACRIKIVCRAKEKIAKQEKRAIDWCVENNIPILVTFMRFKRLVTLKQLVSPGHKKAYNFNHAWLRPTHDERQMAKEGIRKYLQNMEPSDQSNLLYLCDEDGRGCPSCNNCQRLTFGENAVSKKIYSLNLSTSGNNGNCIFHCPDCFARESLAFCATRRPSCDKLFRNKKQKGEMIHE